MPLLLALAALGLAGGSPAATPAPRTVDEIVLVVDQDAMTKGEMEEAIHTYFAVQGVDMPAPGTPDYQQAKKDVVDGFIREVLMAEEADREKIEIQDGDVDHQINAEIENMKNRYPSEQEFEDALKKEGISQDDLKQDLHDQLLRRIKANRILQTKQHELPSTVFVTDAEVQKYFNQHPQDYEQVKFSIILFRIPAKSTAAYVKEVQKQAQGILDQLNAGADFAAFAKKYSEDQASADKGGEMDTMYRMDLNPKLADGIFNIPTDGMGLVKAPDGVYIVKVEHKGTADYATVAPDIKAHLLKQKQDSSFNEWIESLKKDAYIVEDGQVVVYHAPVVAESGPNPANGPAPAATPNPSSPSAAATMAGDQAVTSASAAVTESSDNSSDSREIYPTLPSPGSFTLGLGGEGFSYGTQDLSDYYGPSVSTSQGFPFGFGFHLDLDLAIDPTLQLGIALQGFQKLGETVNFLPLGQPSYSEHWSASTAGPGLEAKVLIPLDESTNFILSAGGGYYFLIGAGVTISGSAVTENSNFSGSNFGGEAAAAVEFFFDDQKDSSLDLEVGYRVLKFQPITSSLTVNDGGPVADYPTPLTNSDGTRSDIDFSGIHIGLGVRFYLDKGD
jgi:parvulin-like peptidyl-prolyl isomerase